MYCPRCGTQANETTKFCRSCGLALTPLTSYVASGGTMPLQPQTPETPKSSNALVQAFYDLEPKQQMIASILFFVFLVPALGILGGIIPPLRGLVPLAAMGMPIGIVWAVMRYKAIERRLQQQRYHAFHQAQVQTPPPLQQVTPPQPATYQPPIPPVQTNPLADSPRFHSSVTEDETQRLPPPPSQKAS